MHHHVFGCSHPGNVMCLQISTRAGASWITQPTILKTRVCIKHVASTPVSTIQYGSSRKLHLPHIWKSTFQSPIQNVEANNYRLGWWARPLCTFKLIRSWFGWEWKDTNPKQWSSIICCHQGILTFSETTQALNPLYTLLFASSSLHLSVTSLFSMCLVLNNSYEGFLCWFIRTYLHL